MRACKRRDIINKMLIEIKQLLTVRPVSPTFGLGTRIFEEGTEEVEGRAGKM